MPKRWRRAGAVGVASVVLLAACADAAPRGVDVEPAAPRSAASEVLTPATPSPERPAAEGPSPDVPAGGAQPRAAVPPPARAGLEPLVEWIAWAHAVELQDDPSLSREDRPTRALQRVATREQLRTLQSHPSELVRFYAFMALAGLPRERTLVSEFLPLALDTTAIATDEGCYGSEGDVASVAFALVRDRLQPREREELLRRVLLSDVLPTYARLALLRDPPHPRLHALLRERARSEPALLPALARYRNAADVPVIRAGVERGLVDALAAVVEFPHASFAPALRTLLPTLLPLQSLKVQGLGVLGPPEWSTHTLEVALGFRDDSARVCRFYQAAMLMPPALANELALAALAPGAPTLSPRAHARCLAFVMSPAALRRHPELGLAVWKTSVAIHLDQVEALWSVDREGTLATALATLPDFDELSEVVARWTLTRLTAHFPLPTLQAALDPTRSYRIPHRLLLRQAGLTVQ